MALLSAELLGRLARLGIENGKAFGPDARMQKIFEQVAIQGEWPCRVRFSILA